jgi:hypothetical protein
MFSGDTKIVGVTITNKDKTTTDLTGATIRWALKRSVHSIADEAVKDTISGGVLITEPSKGKCQVSIDPVDTADLSPGYYYHEMEVTSASGVVSTVLSGTITITEDGIRG